MSQLAYDVRDLVGMFRPADTFAVCLGNSFGGIVVVPEHKGSRVRMGKNAANRVHHAIFQDEYTVAVREPNGERSDEPSIMARIRRSQRHSCMCTWRLVNPMQPVAGYHGWGMETGRKTAVFSASHSRLCCLSLVCCGGITCYCLAQQTLVKLPALARNT